MFTPSSTNMISVITATLGFLTAAVWSATTAKHRQGIQNDMLRLQQEEISRMKWALLEQQGIKSQ